MDEGNGGPLWECGCRSQVILMAVQVVLDGNIQGFLDSYLRWHVKNDVQPAGEEN